MRMPKHEEKFTIRNSKHTVVSVIIIVAALIIISQAERLVSRVPNMAAVISSVVVELTNSDRSAEGLATLSVSESLTQVAEAKANDMAQKSYFAHTSPEGLTPWHWFKEEGYVFAYAGENLAVDFNESADVVRAWMNSPTHRANIVGTQFTEIGVAVAEGTYQGRPATFVVQVFGTPRPAQVAVAPTAPVTITPEAAETPALATTVTLDPVAEEILGQSAGAVLHTTTKVPWWYWVVDLFI